MRTCSFFFFLVVAALLQTSCERSETLVRPISAVGIETLANSDFQIAAINYPDKTQDGFSPSEFILMRQMLNSLLPIVETQKCDEKIWAYDYQLFIGGLKSPTYVSVRVDGSELMYRFEDYELSSFVYRGGASKDFLQHISKLKRQENISDAEPE